MILYFSATGNSEYVAKRIAGHTGEEAVNLLPRLKLEDNSQLHSETPWVIVAPTYAWQLPHIVRDWLEGAQMTGNDRIYFVLTCGTNTAGAGVYARRLAVNLGFDYRGTASVVMPENYIAMFKAPEPEEALQIVNQAEERIDAIAENIRQGAYLDEIEGGRIQSMLMNWGFRTFIISDKKFVVSDNCTSCGQCVRVCPTENIYLDEEKRHPVWTGRCIHCMACINRCPFQAIDYGSGTVNKVRYRCPKTL